MENPLTVFVSSIISGLEAERAAVRSAIQAVPLTRPWLFEYSSASSLPLAESYLSKVRSCDIVVLLLAQRVTDPVREEVATAQRESKALLVFLSATAPREVTAFAQSLGVKYATYADASELAGKVAEAVGNELISGYRQHAVPRADLTPIADFLEKLSAGGVAINLTGDQIATTGPVATRESASASGHGIAVGGQGQTVATGPIGGDFLGPGATKIVQAAQPPEVGRAEEDEALRCYLQSLRRHCEALPLAAFGGEETDDRDLTLDHVYIALDTLTRVALTETEKQALDAKPRLWERTYTDTRPLTALEAATQCPRLALLGEPGAGKSSFVRKLLAWQAAANLGECVPPPGFAADLIPILIIARDLVPRLAGLDLPALPYARQQATLVACLRDQILEDLQRLDAAECARRLRAALRGGRCLLVLDGLDEVPEIFRERVGQAATAITGEWWPAHTVITCRVRSYTGETVIAGFQAHTLAPFDDERVQDFARAWYNAQNLLGRIDTGEAERRAANLASAALGPDLRELATNPMMLTTMAIIHQKEIGLPRERVRLYSLAVDVLLRRWQKRKMGEREMASTPALAEFLKDDLRVRGAMERLAYEAHRQTPGAAATGDLTRGQALSILEAPQHLGDAGLADAFLSYVDQRAGLLVGQGSSAVRPATYAFPHRTFQEYLAGCYLVGQREVGRAYYAHAGQGDTWSLAARLGAEELFYNRRNMPAVLDMAYRLCPVHSDASEQGRRALLWSGQTGALLGRESIERDAGGTDGGTAYLERLLPGLVGLLESSLPAPERAEAGRTLGALGDPRVEVTGLDTMQFCLVPAGPFWLGSKPDDDSDSQASERPERKIHLDSYYISRRPITNGQYQVFVESGGYRDEGLWAEARRAGAGRMVC